MGRIQGRTALITGGARGIGQAIAEKFTQEGARVLICDLLTEKGQQLATALEKQHGQGAARFFQLDVAQEDQWQQCAKDLANEPIDILVNNAAIFESIPTEQMSLKAWRRMFAINVEGVFLACKHIAPILRKNAAQWKGGASIVNLSSTAGVVGGQNMAAYCASKGAVRLFTKALALEYAQPDQPLIRVNSIHPGITDTQLGAQVVNMVKDIGVADNLEGAKMVLEIAHPMGRFALPHEIAALILFLASEDSAYSTGAEFFVDGGYVAR